jgi:hypothetical protein
MVFNLQTLRCVVTRNGNGASIPDFPRGIPSLEDGKFFPHGDVNGEQFSPTSKQGQGWLRNYFPSLFPMGGVKLAHDDDFM